MTDRTLAFATGALFAFGVATFVVLNVILPALHAATAALNSIN